MHTFSIYISKPKVLKLLVVAGLFVLLVLFILNDGKVDTIKATVYLWLGIVFSGAGFIFLLYKYFDYRPQISIDKHGIWKLNNKEEKLYWEQISKMNLSNLKDAQFIKFDIDTTIHSNNKKQIKSLNLHTFLAIDNVAFISLLAELIHCDKKKRDLLIQSFKNKGHKATVSKNHIFHYIAISILLILITQQYHNFFFVVMGVLGVAVLLLKFHDLFDTESPFIVYASKAAKIGGTYLFLLFFILQSTDYIEKSTKNKLTASIEAYYAVHHSYPEALDSIIKTTDLNLLESYFSDELTYQKLEDGYTLYGNWPFLLNE